MIRNLPTSQGYCDSKVFIPLVKQLFSTIRKKGIRSLDVREDVYVGNGVSELIVMAMQALLNNGDEMLVPAPDYPLWTAAVSLSGGTAVHYICDEQADWYPDLDDIKENHTKNRGIVLINPNNPTGAVYSRDFLLEVIEMHVSIN